MLFLLARTKGMLEADCIEAAAAANAIQKLGGPGGDDTIRAELVSASVIPVMLKRLEVEDPEETENFEHGSNSEDRTVYGIQRFTEF